MEHELMSAAEARRKSTSVVATKYENARHSIVAEIKKAVANGWYHTYCCLDACLDETPYAKEIKKDLEQRGYKVVKQEDAYNRLIYKVEW